jgi:hypothetical protein
MIMSTMPATSANTGSESRGTLPGRLKAVPWLTVLPLAAVLSYADGFWMTSLRGAVGAVERSQEPFLTWLRESTLTLPVFVVAVIGALALAARLFGPVLLTTKAILATALIVVVAGTLIGIYEIATSAAYDYSLQTSQAQLMSSVSDTVAGGMATHQNQASLGLQVKAVGYGSGLLLVTNLIVVGWVVAIRGGQLRVRTTRR